MMRLIDMFRGSKKTTAILPTDIVLFIVGPSGAGKSRFMDILLQNANVHAVRANKGQRPGTTEVYAERCRFEGMQSEIVLVDTPSFYTFEVPDGEETVKKWMDSKYTKQCRKAGILYLHNIASNPYDANLQISRHLEAFRRTHPRNLAPGAVHVVPTVASGAKLSVERIKAATAQLHSQAVNVGASMLDAPFDEEPKTAWDVVQGLLNRLPSM